MSSIEELVRRLEERIRKIEVITARTHNISCGDGVLTPYEVVPTPDGDDPTLYYPSLPKLRTVQDIRNLTDFQLNTYLSEYEINRGPLTASATREGKLRLLRRYIGCAVE
ncbi:hypothetical protein ARMSODRAFT_947504 [Armillaria solidipes]|uniref:Mug135-like C-terminal domain-containing protein n=1 Tax=Armillaria solidipes TaxID=1076256 RepID=A0A2H3CTD5_9AGAR|nr:hypothetical protein ARMSODRAFT_947504 [Armillaria solidipes]